MAVRSLVGSWAEVGCGRRDLVVKRAVAVERRKRRKVADDRIVVVEEERTLVVLPILAELVGPLPLGLAPPRWEDRAGRTLRTSRSLPRLRLRFFDQRLATLSCLSFGFASLVSRQQLRPL